MGYELRDWNHAQGLYGFATDRVPTLREAGTKPPFLTQNLSTVDKTKK